MRNDPIVEETRKIRDKIAARFNNDVEALGRYYQSQQSKERRVVVKRSAKRVEGDIDDGATGRD
jgi:hypothetical protein